MESIAVTGATGFIGRATVEELQNRGYAVHILDITRGWDVTTDKLPTKASGVIHLAGLLGTHELFSDAYSAVDVNIKGTLNMLEQAEAASIPFVGIEMPHVWKNVYSVTKHCARDLASAWHLNFGLPVTYVRVYNAFGPGQAYGDGHPQKIFPTFAVAALKNEPLPIWGTGEQVVDLIHVDPVAEMMVDALEHGGHDETYYGGSGLGMTVNEVAGVVTDYASSNSEVVYLPMRRGEYPSVDPVSPMFEKYLVPTETQWIESINWYEEWLAGDIPSPWL